MNSIFPFIQPQRYAQGSTALPMCRDVEWDFKKDCPAFVDGRPKYVNGLPAVVSWAYRALKTPRFTNEIYTWDYGNEAQRLVGTPWVPETKKAEAERYVRECLLQYPYITAVENVAVEFANGELTITLDMVTVYGSAKLEVSA